MAALPHGRYAASSGAGGIEGGQSNDAVSAVKLSHLFFAIGHVALQHLVSIAHTPPKSFFSISPDGDGMIQALAVLCMPITSSGK